MAIIIPHFPPPILQNPAVFHKHPSFLSCRSKTHIRCTVSDSDLAADLASEMARINTHTSLRVEAMRKSRELLFGDLCEYLGVKAEVLKKKWKDMEEDEKIDCARGFVDEWGAVFHPLSLKSVREMVEEHIAEEVVTQVSNPFLRFPDLRRFLRFSHDEEN